MNLVYDNTIPTKNTQKHIDFSIICIYDGTES